MSPAAGTDVPQGRRARLLPLVGVALLGLVLGALGVRSQLRPAQRQEPRPRPPEAALHPPEVPPPRPPQVPPPPDLRAAPAPEMALLGPGRFIMGQGKDGPPFEAEVGRFWLMRYEVSMAEFRRFAEATKARGPLPWDEVEDFAVIAELPVNQVTQGQAAAYCAWRYPGGRLPTEAEWEFAARDGGARPLPWDGPLEAARVNAGDERAPLRGVRSYPQGASSAGVHHLLGNVAEWTQGRAVAYPGGAPPPADHAVVRGGGVDTRLRELGPARRRFVAPEQPGPFIGFRCAQDDPSGQTEPR